MTNEYIEQQVTVGELRELFKSGEYEIEIDTPDGFQPIVNWFDKGSVFPNSMMYS